MTSTWGSRGASSPSATSSACALSPTSTAGSLPKPSWLAEPETLWSPWKLQGETLVEGKHDALRLSLHDQQQAGVDIVSDGEQTRQHFVTTFIEHLSGVDFEKRETIRIRDRYDASVPTVVGAVSRQKPVGNTPSYLPAATTRTVQTLTQFSLNGFYRLNDGALSLRASNATRRFIKSWHPMRPTRSWMFGAKS